jgi:hypothetical protein
VGLRARVLDRKFRKPSSKRSSGLRQKNEFAQKDWRSIDAGHNNDLPFDMHGPQTPNGGAHGFADTERIWSTLDMSAGDSTPKLSVVVTLVSGKPDDLANCLRSLRDQEDAPSLEILVPYDDPCSDVARLSNSYPNVRFLHAEDGLDFAAARASGSHEPFDALRTIGLNAARGRYVALTEDHATLARRWCRTLVDLLEERPDVGAVGAAIECGSKRILNRAICYCDFGRYQNPLPEGPAAFVSDCNVVYRGKALAEIRSVWENGFHEFPAHHALVERGWPIWLTPRATAWQNRVEMTLGEALKERYIWGRAFAGIRFDDRSVGQRLIYAGLTPALPVLLTLRLIHRALSGTNRLREFLPALPYIALLTSFWAAGEFVGYLTGQPNSNVPARGSAVYE